LYLHEKNVSKTGTVCYIVFEGSEGRRGERGEEGGGAMRGRRR
jgi:hypothetical protein